MRQTAHPPTMLLRRPTALLLGPIHRLGITENLCRYISRRTSCLVSQCLQGNSRTTSGTAQAYNYYDPSSAQYTQPPPPPNIQHQPNQQQQAYSVPYWHTANQQPYGATNYSHYDASRHPSQQYQTNYPQGYSATAAPAGPPSASTSRVDEVSRAGSSQAASSAGWPAGELRTCIWGARLEFCPIRPLFGRVQ